MLQTWVWYQCFYLTLGNEQKIMAALPQICFSSLSTKSSFSSNTSLHFRRSYWSYLIFLNTNQFVFSIFENLIFFLYGDFPFQNFFQAFTEKLLGICSHTKLSLRLFFTVRSGNAQHGLVKIIMQIIICTTIYC